MPFRTAPEEPPAATAAWSPLRRILFRFGIVYLGLTSCLWIFEFADKSTALLGRPFLALWHPFAIWIAVHLYHWPGDIGLNFVRDTRYLYALLTVFLIVSLAAAILWSALARKRVEYRNANAWLRVSQRYVLAYLLLHYGMDKVFLLQFPAPSLTRLTEPLSDYSPSSLMWTFIGSSLVYTLFGGLAEVLGGVLLLFRRTTTLGALCSFAVMFNVTVMDFSYDVAVKVLAVHMLIMAAYLFMPDAQRLLNFFVLNRAALPVELGPKIANPSRRRLLLVLKTCVLAYLCLSLPIRDWKAYKQSGPGAARPALYGLYSVDELAIGGVNHPPLVTDAARWRYLIIDTPNQLSIRHMDNSLTSYRAAYDESSHQIRFDSAAAAPASALNVTKLADGDLELNGAVDGTSIHAVVKPVDASKFTLVSRGFHWISETSFIR